MAKVMVIAGGEWQVPLIKKIKLMGHKVVCSNLYENSPGFEFADECYVANVLDRERNLEIAKECKPDLILTDQSDIAVPTVAYVSEQLGLPTIGLKMAELFTNKFKMREFLQKNGFPCPQYLLSEKYEEAEAFVKKVGKCIVKPLDSQSSRGIYVVTGEESFLEKFLDAKSCSIYESKVLVEEFLEGTEFTVDGLKLGTQYEVLAISEKKHYEHNTSVANELFFTNQNDEYPYDKLRDENKKLVNAMGLPFGLTHAEYIYAKGQYYLVEIAARGGGTRISSHIVPIMSGVDNYELLINYLLKKEDADFINAKEENVAAILKFLEFPCGKVKKIEDLEDIIKNEKVIEVRLEFAEGDYLEQPENDRARCGFYIAKADSKEALREFCAVFESELKSKIKIEEN